LAAKHDISYHVHLPLDISISACEAAFRQAAVDTIHDIISLTRDLLPTTYTLHLPYDGNQKTPQDILAWQRSAAKGIELLLDNGLVANKFSIETLDYPFEWAAPLIEDFDLSVCLDFGHLIVNGFNVEKVIKAHAHRTTVIHLHGASDGRDHLPLSRMSADNWAVIGPFIRNFKGIVCLEVFSFDDLAQSLAFLNRDWSNNID
jgi:sugar phosphate isomerase/epimerase